ncbi:MAG TPA: malectin domain-containing carbohydrate-binding protein [Candidatus Sulfotelmatobacter sp.]|nr:malectin domain-containing carbohydrate-binding protein [Candidatus Sulfotelmatobacter sp.]
MRKALALIVFTFATCGMAHAQTSAIRLKCGGPAYTDTKGQAWSADKDFNGGLVSSVGGPVSGTNDPTLFQDGRMPGDSGPLVYSFPVANGSYHVNLYFAELYSGDAFVGGRVFNVKVEGTTVLQNFDIFKTVGANAALIKGVDFAVTNGVATIELDNVPGHDRGKIGAIELTSNSTSTGANPSLTLNFAYPDGTPVQGTLNYSVTSGSVKLNGAVPLDNGQATAMLFNSPSALGLSGQFNVTLSLTDSANHSLWQITLAMDPTNVSLGSVQSSTLYVVVQKQ